MFGSDNIQTVSFLINDPGADNKAIHIWRAPAACEILHAYITVQTAQNSGTAGEFALHNYGTAGTAIKSSGGTIAGAKGGTASPLSAATPYAYTLVEGTMVSGDWVVVDYQETSDWIEVNVTITFDYVLGIGA